MLNRTHGQSIAAAQSHRSYRTAAAQSGAASEMMDTEDGVRFGSRCGDARSIGGDACPVASDVLAELDAAATAATPAATSPLCLFTSLTEAYVEGHVLFLRAALRHAPALAGVPLYVLDQSLPAAARARVAAAHAATRWVTRHNQTAKDVATVTKVRCRACVPNGGPC
jgi:hypothetical protein